MTYFEALDISFSDHLKTGSGKVLPYPISGSKWLYQR